LNGIGRKSLLGNGKKIAKFLMRTFTYRSTFLYGVHRQKMGILSPFFYFSALAVLADGRVAGGANSCKGAMSVIF
jgi:hypothetical protein